MECKTVKEQINIFDSLSQKEKDDVLAHAHSCKECASELINSTKLRDALLELDELEPPEGLAQSAIKKAKKKFKIPSYAYISVAAAAVIAVAFFASPGILSLQTRNSDDSMMAQKVVQEESMKTNGESFASADSAAAGSAEEAFEMTEQPEANIEAIDEPGDFAADEDDSLAADSAEQCYIYVPIEKSEFAEKVNTFLDDKGIYKDNYTRDNTQVILFVVGEINLEEFNMLLEEYEIECDGQIQAGSVIEMTIEN